MGRARSIFFGGGHAVLGEEDFERYAREFRPDEFGRALNYYRRSLNRMTLADLKRYSEEGGLETLAIIPCSERSHLELLTTKILKHAQQITPLYHSRGSYIPTCIGRSQEAL